MKNRIQVSPGIHFGKPCVAGTRIPVESVLERVREGIAFTAIVRDDDPDRTLEEIQACIPQSAIDLVVSQSCAERGNPPCLN